MAKRASTKAVQKIRAPLLDQGQTNVVTKSRRRCCLCFWLDGLDEVVKGQIAHLDQDRSNSAETNLAFLCLEHHDEFDSIPKQSKGLRENEVIHWRDELYREMAYRFRDHTSQSYRRQEEFKYLEQIMPDLLSAMRADLRRQPLARLISLTPRDVRHSAPFQLLPYIFGEIPELPEKARVLQNYGLLKHDEDTFYWITEELATYLRSTS